MGMNDIITVDVGGTRFRSLRQTLIKYPNSILARIFHSESSLPPGVVVEDGVYFIDRSPDRFKYILDYLRDGELKVKKSLSTEMLLALQAEADYFQLPNILTNIGTENDSIKINVEGEIVNVSKSHLDYIIPAKSLFWCIWQLDPDGDKVYLMRKRPFEKFKLTLNDVIVKRCKPSDYLFDPFDETTHFSLITDLFEVQDQVLQILGKDLNSECVRIQLTPYESNTLESSNSSWTLNVPRSVVKYLIPAESSFWCFWYVDKDGVKVFNSGRNWLFTAFCSNLREAVYTKGFTDDNMMRCMRNLFDCVNPCPSKKMEIYQALGLLDKIKNIHKV